MQLSVIIVTWNSAQYIVDCIDSLYAAVGDIRTEIIVIDNASSDATCSRIAERFPEVLLQRISKNLGFGQGNMLGIRKARGTFVLLLNPDTILSQKTLFSMMQWLLQNPRTGAVGPRQLNESGHEIFTYSNLSVRGILLTLLSKIFSAFGFHIPRDILEWVQKPRKVPFLNLGCVLTRRTIWKQGIAFDPKLFLYGEELDIFTQMNKIGWESVYLPSVCMYHFREKSIKITGKKYWYVFESYRRVLSRMLVQKLFG